MTTRTIAQALVATALLGGGGTVAVDQAQNPYSDKGTHYELPVAADVSQNDRLLVAKTSAKVTLSRWNDERQITIQPVFPGTAQASTARRPLMSKRMEFTRGDITAFVEPRDASEFDIDFTLAARPASNVFAYKVSGAEDASFNYQPPLDEEFAGDPSRTCTATQCVGKDGKITDERPDNVVGSYAVYSKTKRDNVAGQTSYGTGKLFHVYRPKAIDANGSEVWAELRYSEGLLTVSVPQDFLDEATYPVTVDPTFGYTAVGATITNLGANILICSYYTSPSDVSTIQDVVIRWSTNPAAGNLRGLIIASSTNTIITDGIGSGVAAATSATWYTSVLSNNPAASPSTIYKLCAIGDNGGFSLARDSAAGPNSQYNLSSSYSSPTAPATYTSFPGSISMYADYTAASGGGGPTTNPADTLLFE